MNSLKLSNFHAAELKIISSEKVLTSKESEKNMRSGYMFGFNGIEKTNEIAGVGNHYTALFGEYNPRIVYRWNTDPKAKTNISPYAMFYGNPISNSDVLLDDPSTHTDNNGNVIAVYKDGDNGVYKHENNADAKAPTRSQIDKRHEESKSAGGVKMGETEYWDEFTTLDKKEPTSTIIYSNDPRETWKPLISWGNQHAKTIGLMQTMQESKRFQPLDIKNNMQWAQYGPMTGRLLNEKFATARSAGNYLAGLNGVTVPHFWGALSSSKYLGSNTYIRLAGAYQVLNKMNKSIFLNVTMGSKAYGPAPYYGEEEYSGRRIIEGTEAGMEQRK